MRRALPAIVAGVLVASCALDGPRGLGVLTPDLRRVDAVVVDARHGTPEVTSHPQITIEEYRRLQRDAGPEVTVSLDSLLTTSGRAAAPLTAAVSAPATRADDPLRASQWHLDAVHADEGWSAGTTGVTVAVLDTGVVDVDGIAIDASASFVDQSLSAFEHGTEVGATLAASGGNGAGGVGVAPGVHVLSVRVCIATLCPTSAVARGIVWAVDEGADVINLSLGGGYSAVLDRAVAYAIDHGVSVVAAAGNGSCAVAGPTCDPDADNVGFPAALPGVVAVTSVGATGHPSVWTSKGRRVTVAAPGEDIWMSGPGLYGTAESGTSFASPIVAGVVAEMRAAAPSLSPSEVAAALRLASAVPAAAVLPRPGLPADWYYGAGVVDAGRAVAVAERLDGARWPAPSVVSRAGAVDLSWTAVAGATSYDVRVDGRPPMSVTTTHLALDGLVDDQAYGIAVEARTAAGVVQGRPTLATSTLALPTPVVLGATDAADGSGEVTLQLQAVPLQAGMLEARLDGRALGRVALPGTASPAVRVPLGGDVGTGQLDVWYVSDAGGRSPSATVTVSATHYLAAPSDVRTTIGSGRIDLSWGAVPGATVYDVDVAHVDRSTGAARWVTSSYSTTATSTSLSPVVDGATYHVSVNSRVVLTGAMSPPVDVAAIALPPPPAPPTSLAVDTVGGDTVRLRFPLAQGGDRYLLSSSTSPTREISPASAGDGSAEIALPDGTFHFGRRVSARLCVAVIRLLDGGGYTQYGPWSSGVTFRLGGPARTSDGTACTDVTSLTGGAGGAGFSARTPIRLVDTRRSEALAAGGTLEVPVAGTAGIDAEVSAVAVNVTAVEARTDGFLTVWPCDADRPLVSSVNFARGETSSNSVFSALGDGRLCVYSSAAAQVIVDLTGTFTGTAPSYSAVAPVRLLDTRRGDLGGRVRAATTVTVPIAGHGGVPAGAGAVTVNVTGIDADAAGYVTLWPCDSERPTTSNLNLVPGSTRPNLVTVGLSAAGEVCLYTQSPLDLAVDLAGWWGSSGATAFTSVPPRRLVDSRSGQGIASRLVAGHVVEVPVGGSGGVPVGAAVASMNVTVVGPAGDGFLAAWDCSARPDVSNLNFAKGQTIPNAVAVAVSARGTVCLYANAATDVVIDVNGYWA